jgi:hypothetical protein
MGSGTSVSAGGISEITNAIDVREKVDGISTENESFFFAYQVVISEYERLKSLQEKGGKSALGDIDGMENKEDKDAKVDSLAKFDRWEVLYMAAILEWKLPLEECSNPIVMVYICINIYEFLCIYSIYICINVLTYIHLYTHVCAYMLIHVYIYINRSINTPIYPRLKKKSIMLLL